MSASQKREAAETFDAESKFVSMGKKLLDTNHHAWKSLIGVRGKIVSTWKHNSLPFPKPGIRLIKRRNVDSFTATLNNLRHELRDAERDLDNHYDELRSMARNRLGSLYNSNDYPASMIGMFDVAVDYPSVEAPEYLRSLSPALYRQEAERVRVRFDEAVKLAEDAFLGELTKLVDHLAERISGSEDGKPKIFRDTVVTNLVEFFDRFRRLNIGSSEDLDSMVADVRRIVGNTTASDLRNNATLRQHVAGELSRVQVSLDGLMVDRPAATSSEETEGPMQIVVKPNGMFIGIYSDQFDYGELGRPQIRRASHVEPTDDGRWTADLSPVDGPVLGPFNKRSEALNAEIECLNLMMNQFDPINEHLGS